MALSGTTLGGRLPQVRLPNLGEVLTGAFSRLKLHHLLFVVFTAIAAVPVLLLQTWVQRTAMEHELRMVREKHLLVAQHLGSTLDRYATDAEALFHLAAESAAAGIQVPELSRAMSTMKFDHICIVQTNGTIDSYIATLPQQNATAMSLERLAKFQEVWANGKGRDVAFSDLMADPRGEPKLYMVRKLADGRFAVAGLSTDFFVAQQQKVTFGLKGHAMIVDAKGHVIAHPQDALRRKMQDLSALNVVQQMRAGETGVAQFYSPPMRADMIAGFTSVARTGWGVMVPQPMSELIEHAGDTQSAAFLIAVLGMGVAAVLSWLLSSYVSGPVVSVVEASRRMAAGRLDARAEPRQKLLPSELHTLTTTFNAMAGAVAQKSRALEETAIEANAANRAKTDFLANMSHELRTPLNAIIGFSEMMQTEVFGPLNQRYVGYVADINAAGARLLTMINDILEVSRGEANAVGVELGDVDLGQVVGAAQRMVWNQAEEKGLDLRGSVTPAQAVIRSDEMKLRQILLNLLTNAVTFTPPGGKVSVDVTHDDEAGTVLRVVDTGIGIAAADIPKVLAPFGQVEGAFARNHQGAGLGLVITRRLAEMMGGTLELESDLGAGTAVTVRLPSLAVETPQALAA